MEHLSAKLDVQRDGDLRFRGIASVFGATVDTVPPTIIERGAFTRTLADRDQVARVRILLGHDTAKPIGRPRSLRQTSRGLEIEAQLDDVELSHAIMKQIRSGTLTDLSIGFDAIAGETRMTKDGPVRFVSEVRLWEISVVTFGAQAAARIERPLSKAEAHGLKLAALADARIAAALADRADHRLRMAGAGRS